MRRLIWRWDPNTPWIIYGFARMHFGDRPAICGLKVTKQKVVALGEAIDPAASWMITQGYVDDGSGGGSQQDVDRLVGEEHWEDGKPTYTGTVAQILALGSFKLKVMVRDGESRQEV